MKKVTINYFIKAIETYNDGWSCYDYLVSLAGYYATNHKRPLLFDCDQESGKVTRLYMVDSLNPIKEYKTVWKMDGLEEKEMKKVTIEKAVETVIAYNTGEVELSALIDFQHEWNNTRKTILNYVFETSCETILNEEVVAIYISRKSDNRKIRDVWKRACTWYALRGA